MSADTAAAGTPYGTIPPASPLPQRKPISLPRLAQLRAAGEKITMLTAYDATFAAVADAAGVETILVGDSLGMVCQGLPSTVGVSLETMAYHTASVARGLRRAQGTAWVVADLPYGSYQESAEQAMRSATVLMQAGAHMVKLEGGGWTAPIVRFLVERGIPVCAHLGLTPQTVHALGGYRVQGTAWLVADLPFGSYHASREQALHSASALMQAGAHMVKLEGGGWTAPTVEFLVQRGVPVCAHLGLTPQTVHALGGYRVQGKTEDAARTLRKEALELQNAGAAMLVLEMVPAVLAAEITAELPHCHTIGIGAGNGTAGQVLVLHDMLGVNLGKMARFVHNFMQDAGSVRGAMEAYVQAVKQGRFPDNTLHAW